MVYLSSFLRAAATAGAKTTTNLTGLKIAKNPHHHLTGMYTKTLRALAKMPEDAAYRQYTEQIISERLNAVKAEPDLAALEAKINCGQIEEVLIQAENELFLARKMLEWKPWEPLVEEPPKNQWKWPM
ncbi:unnamed protein product [Notodromas monacha]|uniref:NADH dehydrogenase [ubiquinone] 1 alpha subcomplex subunit 5 n=1 Tax=Notodromas monacha TaxID=399045 RepID=A0A7R9BNK4_9CRUS|nr:unnamed protein product [Notodromas monacha]CAG0917430.1 unnamed protein product [Notodromas monacha]